MSGGVSLACRRPTGRGLVRGGGIPAAVSRVLRGLVSAAIVAEAVLRLRPRRRVLLPPRYLVPADPRDAPSPRPGDFAGGRPPARQRRRPRGRSAGSPAALRGRPVASRRDGFRRDLGRGGVPAALQRSRPRGGPARPHSDPPLLSAWHDGRAPPTPPAVRRGRTPRRATPPPPRHRQRQTTWKFQEPGQSRSHFFVFAG